MAARHLRLIGVLAIAAGAAAAAVPAAAQVYYWSDRSSSQGGYYQQQAPQQRDFFSFPFFGNQHHAPVSDSTKAPPPRKLETPPTSTVVVIGDSMADWLGYGLDEIYADQPDTGVERNVRATSGLIHYDAKNEQLDWSGVIKDQLAAEKPKAIVVMLGLNDRIPLREGGAAKTTDKSADQATQAKAAADKAAQDKTAPDKAADKATQDKATQDKAAQEKAAQDKTAPDKANQDKPAAASEAAPAAQQTGDAASQRPVPGRSYDFHTDQWADLYVKRIDEMIAALKSKGVPVLWVGLPALRGPKSTSDMAYLDELFRERAERAGIGYVDIWDGFVDDQGRYAVDGPDYEGQIRRLRTADGVHFTKAGAVKLASYVDQELRRVMSNHIAPIALPEQGTTPANKPGSPRPDVGPVLPLAVSSTDGGAGGLVGANRTAPLASDPLTQKVLDRGAPLGSVAGRADDFAWPPHEAPIDAAVPPAAPVAAEPAKKGAAGTSGAAPAEAKKDAKKKPDKDADTRKDSDARKDSDTRAHAPRAALDGAPRPPKDIGGGF